MAYLLSASDVVCPKLASCLLDSNNCVWLSTVYQVTDAEILIGADVHSGDQGYRSLTYTSSIGTCKSETNDCKAGRSVLAEHVVETLYSCPPCTGPSWATMKG